MFRMSTPLWLRKIVGPYLAYLTYFTKVNFLKNRTRPKVLSLDETINLIKNKDLSIIRFGDGEMSAIANHDLLFQKKDTDLANKLRVILQAKESGLLICVPGIFEKLNHFTGKSFWFTLHHLFKYGHMWNDLLNKNQVYGDAFITRPYLTYHNRSHCKEIFEKMIDLWKGQDVVLIEGSKSRLGVGNDLFKNVKTLGRILCPPENAYSKYTLIKDVALKIPHDRLILLSLGPTAKVLAYELFLLGYRVLDIGHLDMEYEMFLKGHTELVNVKYKYFNEINERNPEECTDKEYTDQILADIK